MPLPIRLDVISDFVCPWCWLGKKRLEAAQAHDPEINVEVIWRPFQLDPTVPARGVPYDDYVRAKFSGILGDDRFAPMRRHLEEAASDYGIRFRFEEIPLRPNTFNAHRVMVWAQDEGRASAMAEALFFAFFEELRDIGDLQTLADIAGDVGLDRAEVGARLAMNEDVERVSDDEAFFRRLGISNAPTYIADGQRVVVGAHEAATLHALLRESFEAQATGEQQAPA